MNTNWTSIRVIYDRLLRDPLFIGITFESIVDYFIDFINIVGAPNLFDEKISSQIPILDYKAALPPDFVSEIQIAVRENGNIKYSANEYMQGKFAKYSTNSFAKFQKELSEFYGSQYNLYNQNVAYRISGSNIYFNIKSGDVIIAYNSVMTNTDVDSIDYGLPMIPDDPVFMSALQAYIEVQFLKILWRAGKIGRDIYEDSKQIYAFKVGQYETHSKKITLGQMDAISKMFRNIHQKTNEFSSGFKNLSSM